MTRQQSKMLNRAIAEHKDKRGRSQITLCPGGTFTESDGWLYLWYNTLDKSTHIIKERIQNDN